MKRTPQPLKARARWLKKIIAPKIGGVTLADGARLKAEGQLAGFSSVLFDAVAIVVSDAGCTDILSESAAIDFANDAFVRLKAIGFTQQAMPLLQKAGVVKDAGVLDSGDGVEAFIEQAQTRQWVREPSIPHLPMGKKSLKSRASK